jgi:hypothetical protein
MSETPQKDPARQAEVELARERTNQVTTAGWTAGVSAFFAVGAMAAKPTWPVAVGICAVAAMVAVVCHGILRR